MSLIYLLLIALGLSMDALAVSITIGVTVNCFAVRHAFRAGLFFGGFQALMPLIGWAAGQTFSAWIKPFDHWVAFGLLAIIGGKMVIESLRSEKKADDPSCDPTNIVTMLGLAIATSIDALAVGLSLSCLEVRILYPVLVIGGVTFLLSFLGVWAGARVRFGKRFEIIGGVVLIGVGLKILLSHLFG
jgi:manganese efflux pump family protein